MIDVSLRINCTVISHDLKYMIFMPAVCCVLWISVGPPDAQKPFVTIIKFGKQNVNLGNNDHPEVPWTRTDIGLSSCNIKGATLWNENFEAVNSHLYKLCFKAKVTKYFIQKYLWHSYKTTPRPNDRENEYLWWQTWNIRKCSLVETMDTRKPPQLFSLFCLG